MQIDLIAVGKRMPEWVETACKEYAKRLPDNISVKRIDIRPATGGKKSPATDKKREQEKIEAALADNSLIIALDEKGTSLSSRKLADLLQRWNAENQHVSFIIGGADGLSDAIKNRADLVWSLSEMTLPHGLVRIMLLEQIYRAWTITQNHPYHRE